MGNNIVEHKTSGSLMQDAGAIESYKNMAKLMAQAQIQIPEHFKGKPADCLAVVMQAAQWQMNPFVVAQKTFVVNGVLGYEAQLINAVVSSSKFIDSRFKYEFKGERLEWKPKWAKENKGGRDIWKPQFSDKACVRVGAKITGDDDITWGEWVYPCDQTIFNSPLWRTNPKQQVGYLAVKFWARFYTPDVLLGAYTPDELHDHNERDITPQQEQRKAESGVMGKLREVEGVEKESPAEEATEAFNYNNLDLSTEHYDIFLKAIKNAVSQEQLIELKRQIVGDKELQEFDTSALLDEIEEVEKELREH
jgi:hypothetical protein